MEQDLGAGQVLFKSRYAQAIVAAHIVDRQQTQQPLIASVKTCLTIF